MSFPADQRTTTPPTPARETRMPALDGVRGLAIAAVFLWHATPDSPTGWFSRAFSWGWMGVDLFFVLSGFLITGILLDALDQPPRVYYGCFYARRALRLAPALCLYLTVLFYLIPYLGLLRPLEVAELRAKQGWYWSYLVNMLVAKSGTFDAAPLGTAPLWSLAVEEQFYLIWPFLVARAGTARRVLLLSAGVIIAAMAFRGVGWAVGIGGARTYVLTLTRADTLAWGALLASLLRLPTGEQIVARYRGHLVVLGVALIALASMLQQDPAWPAWDGLWVQTFAFPGLAMLSTALISYAIGQPSGLLTWSSLRILGVYSYALYLWHATVLVLLERLTDERSLLFVAAGALVCAVPATLSWITVEAPALRWKRLFPMAQPRRDAVSRIPAPTRAA